MPPPYGAIAVVAAVACAAVFLSDRKLNMFRIWNMMSAGVDERLRDTKRWLIDAQGLQGTVLEIGPGIGSTLAYLENNTRIQRLILTEPNNYMHPKLREEAQRRGFAGDRLQLLDAQASSLPLEDGSVDAAISCLVLCSVPDQMETLKEVQRVLKPGGRLLFIEHVMPKRDAPFARAQASVLTQSGIWPWIGDGCQLTRETGETIKSLGSWASVDIHEVSLPYSFLPAAKRHVYGVAVKQ